MPLVLQQAIRSNDSLKATKRVLRKSEEKGNSASVEAWIDRLYD